MDYRKEVTDILKKYLKTLDVKSTIIPYMEDPFPWLKGKLFREVYAETCFWAVISNIRGVWIITLDNLDDEWMLLDMNGPKRFYYGNNERFHAVFDILPFDWEVQKRANNIISFICEDCYEMNSDGFCVEKLPNWGGLYKENDFRGSIKDRISKAERQRLARFIDFFDETVDMKSWERIIGFGMTREERKKEREILGVDWYGEGLVPPTWVYPLPKTVVIGTLKKPPPRRSKRIQKRKAEEMERRAKRSNI